MNSRAYQRYDRFHHWWSKVEKRLIIIALLLFMVMYASQFMNFIITERGGILLTGQIEKLEGKSISNSQTTINTGTIELSIVSSSDYSNIQIYVNGEYNSSFSKKSISLTVKNNDIIEISGIKNEYPAKIKITNVTENLLGMRTDETIIVSKGFTKLGRVRLK